MKDAKRPLWEILFPIGTDARIKIDPLGGCRYVVTEREASR